MSRGAPTSGAGHGSGGDGEEEAEAHQDRQEQGGGGEPADDAHRRRAQPAETDERLPQGPQVPHARILRPKGIYMLAHLTRYHFSIVRRLQ